MKAIVAALGLAVIVATAATGASAAPSATPVARTGPSLAAPAAAAPARVELAGGYGYGYGYGRPSYGHHHWRPHRPHRPRYGYYPRPRTKIVERRCSTRVVQRTPYGRVVTVYQYCGRRW